MDEEEMTKERECERFEETLGAIVKASDEEVYIKVDEDYIKKLRGSDEE
jgi:hypothetical protein